MFSSLHEHTHSRLSIAASILRSSRLTLGYLCFLWLWFLIQYYGTPLHGLEPRTDDWYRIYAVLGTHPEHVWTVVTAAFSHANLNHLLTNTIPLFIFGSYLERHVLSRRTLLALILSIGPATLALYGIPYWMHSVNISAMGASAVWFGLGAIACCEILQQQTRTVLSTQRHTWRDDLGWALVLSTLLALIAAPASAIAIHGITPGATGTADLAHAISLLLGLGWWLMTRWNRTRVTRGASPPNPAPSSESRQPRGR